MQSSLMSFDSVQNSKLLLLTNNGGFIKILEYLNQIEICILASTSKTMYERVADNFTKFNIGPKCVRDIIINNLDNLNKKNIIIETNYRYARTEKIYDLEDIEILSPKQQNKLRYDPLSKKNNKYDYDDYFDYADDSFGSDDDYDNYYY